MDLYNEKGFVTDKIMEIEITLEKLKISESAINAIKKSIIPNKYLYLVSWLRNRKIKTAF